MSSNHYIPGAVPSSLEDTADFPALPESAAAPGAPPPGQTTVVTHATDTWVMPKLADAPAAPAPAPASLPPGLSEDLLRLMREESARLRAELAASHRDRDELKRQQDELRRQLEELKRQLDERSSAVLQVERQLGLEAERSAHARTQASEAQDRNAATAAELEAREAELREAERRLGAAEAQAGATEAQLREAEVRLGAAEGKLLEAEARVEAAEGRQQAAEAQLRSAEAGHADLRARIEGAQAELALYAQQRERQSASQSEQDRDRARREAALAHSQEQLSELHRRVAGHVEALRRVEGQRHIYDSQLREREAMLDEAQARLRDATVARERSDIERAAAMARAELAEHRLAQRPEPALPPPPPAPPSPDPALQERIAALELQLAEASEQQNSLRQQLQGAHETHQALRAELDERSAASLHVDTVAAQAAPVVAVPAPPVAFVVPTAAALVPTAATLAPGQEIEQLLVRTSGETGIVHVLGRRTTIGRTPDNDIRVEADYVSRHHAVVLVNPGQTIVEDLNSTNGVFVNGVRITRYELLEGDLISIGETSFRYVLKPAPVA